jgi:outer membrane protein
MRFPEILFLLLFLFFFSDQSLSQETLSLEEAIKIALSNNYSINIARNESEIAKNNVSLGNAGALPSLDVSGSYIKSSNDTKQEYFDGRTINRNGAKSTNITAGVNLNWTIFDGLRMYANLDMFKELNRIGEDNFREKVETNLIITL